ncbi:hypothetical protein QFC22_004377 [Naganishia vaughanmartiniae]|uniref:Uncharacterized protein n=1 Tax=Naganishia vaughanmartiniae TaxID=1424756 RepID=A0ACC2X423_9TREE|nr:hypothetical protein QFC22_004377 [Naganishia vaughanmartiniae]
MSINPPSGASPPNTTSRPNQPQTTAAPPPPAPAVVAAFDDSLDQFLEKPAVGQTEEEYAAVWEERWNARIDKDVAVLGEGLGKMLDILQNGLTPSAHASETSHLQSQLLSSTILDSATSLLSLTHQLKLLALLSDTSTASTQQEREQKALQEQVEGLREGVRGLVMKIADDELT